jgi:hypothetical protein
MFFKNLTLSFFSIILLGCISNEVRYNSAYHPYLFKSLCVFTITGEINRLIAVSIVLDEKNMTELNPEEIKARDVSFHQNGEYFIPTESVKENKITDRIPCKKQIIRLRYQLKGIEQILDLDFLGKNNQQYVLKEKKDGSLFYEIK